MKRISVLLTFFQLLTGTINAQCNCSTTLCNDPCDSTPANCCWDLTATIFDEEDIIILDDDDVIKYGKGTMSSDYHDVSFESDDNNCEEPHTTWCSGNGDHYNDTLKIRVFYPKHDYSDATGCKLPAFIFVHGGGFSDCTEGGATTYLCTQMACRGWVVFDVEYRRGVLHDPVPGMSVYTSVFQMQAAYRAAQDIRGAIRFIIYREQNHSTYNDPYRIDIDNIFLGGESAGAVTVLTAAYGGDQDQINESFPVRGPNDVNDVMQTVDFDFYKGDDSYDYMGHIRGVLSMWGAVFVPHSFHDDPASFFAGLSHTPPVIAFHGLEDKTIPPGSTWLKFSPGIGSHAAFNETNFCTVSGTYKLEDDDGTPHDLLSLGSKAFYDDVLTQLTQPVASEIYLDCEMEHGWQENCTDCDFGTGANSQDELNLYIVQRTAIFFQSIMNENLDDRTKELFRECENFRVCGSPDDYDNCSPCN